MLLFLGDYVATWFPNQTQTLIKYLRIIDGGFIVNSLINNTHASYLVCGLKFFFFFLNTWFNPILLFSQVDVHTSLLDCIEEALKWNIR